MGNFENSWREDPEALIDLLEDIVATYQDNDSRPADALSLYRQRVQLGSSYRVKLAKRFVVVDGGAGHEKIYSPKLIASTVDRPQLRLVAKLAVEP